MKTKLITIVALAALSFTASHATAQGQTDGAAGTPLVLPRPDFHFSGNVGRTYLDSDQAAVPAAGAGAEGRAEHRADPDRRRRLRAVQHLRRRRSVADDGQAGGRGPALQPLPYHRAVQPDARRADHRPQPSLGGVRAASPRLATGYDGYTCDPAQELRHASAKCCGRTAT